MPKVKILFCKIIYLKFDFCFCRCHILLNALLFWSSEKAVIFVGQLVVALYIWSKTLTSFDNSSFLKKQIFSNYSFRYCSLSQRVRPKKDREHTHFNKYIKYWIIIFNPSLPRIFCRKFLYKITCYLGSFNLIGAFGISIPQ